MEIEQTRVEHPPDKLEKEHKNISKAQFCSRIDPVTVRILILGLFTIIAMTVGIAIVCLTSPKLSKTCQMTFKRVGKSSISLSSEPSSVAVGDLNNDNETDIVVVNSGTNTIGIFLSQGNGTFSNQQTYPTGLESRPSWLVISDFNNDNYLDIAVTNYGTNNIGIFLGYGNGTFVSQKVFSTGSSHPLFITVGNFNKDNRLDIAVVNYGTDSIGIFLGNGDGSFQKQTTYSTGYDSHPYSLVVGDFNHDSQLDIAVANFGTNNVGIFLGYGDGTFVSQTTYTTPHNSNPSGIAVGDFNDDKELDIVITNYGSGNIGILLGHANGTFAPQITYSINSQSRPKSIEVGYFDQDNHLDVVVVDSENNQIHIISGYGNGSFVKLSTYDSIAGSRPISVAVVDFDNNNQSNIVVANYGTHNLLTLGGYSSKPSARQNDYFVGLDSRTSSVVTYDFNNDGILDIAVDNFNNGYILILNGIGNGTFVNGEIYQTGNNSAPQYLCIGDLNNDNRMDIVIANVGTDCVGVLLAQDNGTFNAIVTYSTGIGSTPWYAAVGDVNNDKQLDIISANTGSNSIGVLLGYGNGTFANMTSYSTGVPSFPWSVVIYDVNNDSHLDLAVVISSPDNVGIFLGNGDGTFGIFTTYSTGFDSYPYVLVLADFNQDHRADIAVTNTNTANIGVFLGNGDGTFKEQVTYPTGFGSLPNFLALADFNNDHYYDIAVTNYGTAEVVILFGDGNGSFALARTYPVGLGSCPFGLAIADLNNDNHLEIIVTFWGTGYVSILTEYYAAEFANQTIYPTGSAPHPYSLAVGDFNNDNRSDIVIANSDTDNIGILLSMTNGSFGVQMKYWIGTNSYPQYVITGDINKDNNLDIVTVNSRNDTISIIMGYGNGSFAAQLMYSTGDSSHPYAMAMGDLNNDNRLDFVIANSGTDSIGIFFGFDYASFQNQKTYSNGDGLAPNGVVVSDFNNDHYLDVAIAFRDSNNLAILLGNGDGSFGIVNNYSTEPNSIPVMLAVNDFNNDGQMDIGVANSGANNIGIFLGYGDGNFSTMITYSTGDGSIPRSFAAADFNNDSLIDIVVVNFGSNNIAILLGYGNGSFHMMITYSTGDFSTPFAATVGDFNNDGQLDIAVANYGTNNIGIFLGYGTGNFEVQVIYSTGFQSWPAWLIISDFNSDNRSDIAVANYNGNNVGILLGYPNGSFADVVTYSSGDGSSPLCLSVGDFNDDKKLDIAVANYASSNVLVLFGFGDGTFLSGRVYSTGIGSSTISVAIGDFNNDTRLDIVVANYMSNNIGIFLGYGREPFAGVTKYTDTDGSQPHSVALGDLNNDGWLDVVIANYGTDNLGILLGLGDGGYNTITTYSTGIGSCPYYVAIADFNNDKNLDIAVTNSATNNVAIFLGYGNGVFGIPVMYSTGIRSNPYTIAIGDLNNDNRLDIVIANSGTSNIFLLYGHGNGSFGNVTSYTLGYNYDPYSVAVTDLNQDDWMDIVIACYGTDNIETLVKMC